MQLIGKSDLETRTNEGKEGLGEAREERTGSPGGPRGWVELGRGRRRQGQSWASQLCQSHAAVCQVPSEKAFI